LKLVVNLDDFMPTEPYSKAPAKIGKNVFSWKIEEIFGKIEKLSVTLVYKRGNYTTGTIMPIRSYLIDMYPEKVLDLLADEALGMKYDTDLFRNSNHYLKKS
jgi:hypothetical protein